MLGAQKFLRIRGTPDVGRLLVFCLTPSQLETLFGDNFT